MTLAVIGFVVKKHWYDKIKRKHMDKVVSRRYTVRSAAEEFARLAKANEPQLDFTVSEDVGDDGIGGR